MRELQHQEQIVPIYQASRTSKWRTCAGISCQESSATRMSCRIDANVSHVFGIFRLLSFFSSLSLREIEYNYNWYDFVKVIIFHARSTEKTDSASIASFLLLWINMTYACDAGMWTHWNYISHDFIYSINCLLSARARMLREGTSESVRPGCVIQV